MYLADAEDEMFVPSYFQVWNVDPAACVGLVHSNVLHSNWSRANDVLLSLVEMVHFVATPALICPAQNGSIIGILMP